MKKTPKLPTSTSLLSVGALITAMLAGCDGSSIVSTGDSSLISYCHDIKGYRAPKNPHLTGRERGEVYCMVDGDTFDVMLETRGMIRVRLWGVDCPESSNNSKCRRQNCNISKGKKISKKVKNMLGEGLVTLEPPYKNNGNRKLAYIKLNNGVDLGREMIRRCLCESGYDHQRKTSYKRVGKQCR